MDFTPVSERLCKLRMRGIHRNLTFINIHAPTEEAGLDDKEEFYNILEAEIEKIPNFDLKI